MWHVQAVEYYSALKGKQELPYAMGIALKKRKKKRKKVKREILLWFSGNEPD